MDERSILNQSEEEPPSGPLDPKDEAWWTLPMTCAWVIWRDFDRVRGFWDKFQAARVRPHPIMTKETVRKEGDITAVNMTLHGFELQEAEKPNLNRINLTLALEQHTENKTEKVLSRCSLDDCLGEIIALAKHDRFVISGFSPTSRKREDIAAVSFEDLEVKEFNSDGVLRYRHGGQKGSVAYTHLRFSSKKVLETWPEDIINKIDEWYFRNRESISQELPDFRDERSVLIELVESGSMALHDAENEARLKGFEPLHVPPSASDYDVLTMPVWTIDMVVPWIIWRDLNEVVKFQHEYHERWTWPRSPFDLTLPLSLEGVRQEYETQIKNKPSVESFDRAMILLIDALKDKAITACAVNQTNMQDDELESSKWRYLELITARNGPTQFADASGVRFGMITFSKRDVMAKWPPSQSIEGLSPPNLATQQQMIQGDVGRRGRPPSKQQIRDTIVAASVYFNARQLLMWTKNEAESELPKFFEANSPSRVLCRQIFAELEIALLFPEKRGRRGPVNSQRQMELDEFRRSFVAANMRN